MFESFVEVLRSFSFQSVLRGNLMTSPGSFGNQTNGLAGSKSNSPASSMVSNRYMSTYFSKMQEIKDYEISDLTNIQMGIFMDFIKNYFVKDEDKLIELVDESLPNRERDEADLNKTFIEDLDIVGEIKAHLWDIIYEGSYSFKIAYDPEERSYKKFYLQNPHNVIDVKKGRDLYCRLVTSRDGKIYEVKPESIIRLGSANLTLVNDINTTFFGKQKEDTLVKDDNMMAGMPLYYNITAKVKEYLLKEQILSLLGIKDLVQPLLLLVRMDKNTPIDEGNKAALNIENMINKYSDISSILGSNFSINSLLDSLLNNIRVIPDYHSSMGDMNNIDLSKITNKIQEIENTQENKKESILTSNSIPRALFNGESTKWDAIKSSQRLNSKINGFVININDGVGDEIERYYYQKTGRILKKGQYKIHLFTKTDVDYNVEMTNLEIVSQLVDGIGRILSSCNQTLQEAKFVDPEQYANFILEKLKVADPDVVKFMSEKTIKQFIMAANTAEQQSEG